jgi:hypothetical protein
LSTRLCFRIRRELLLDVLPWPRIDLDLIQRLQSQPPRRLARAAGSVTTYPDGAKDSPFRSPPARQSAPLLPALPPARSTACSTVSVVSTPNAIGTPDSSAMRRDAAGAFAGDVIEMRCLAADHRAQRDDAHRSGRDSASLRATMGISNAPGTRTISICFSLHAVALQRIESAAQQRFDHEIVEARRDHDESQIASQQFSLNYLRLIIGHRSFLKLRLASSISLRRSFAAIDVARHFQIEGREPCSCFGALNTRMRFSPRSLRICAPMP